jgi:hypothetical protein
MAKYKISGVWKDVNKVITHYAFHEEFENSISRAMKKIKIKQLQLWKQKGILLTHGCGIINVGVGTQARLCMLFLVQMENT